MFLHSVYEINIPFPAIDFLSSICLYNSIKISIMSQRCRVLRVGNTGSCEGKLSSYRVLYSGRSKARPTLSPQYRSSKRRYRSTNFDTNFDVEIYKYRTLYRIRYSAGLQTQRFQHDLASHDSEVMPRSWHISKRQKMLWHFIWSHCKIKQKNYGHPISCRLCCFKLQDLA
jgi:hypothetical protein